MPAEAPSAAWAVPSGLSNLRMVGIQGQSQVRQPARCRPLPSSSKEHMDSSRKVGTVWGRTPPIRVSQFSAGTPGDKKKPPDASVPALARYSPKCPRVSPRKCLCMFQG